MSLRSFVETLRAQGCYFQLTQLVYPSGFSLEVLYERTWVKKEPEAKRQARIACYAWLRLHKRSNLEIANMWDRSPVTIASELREYDATFARSPTVSAMAKSEIRKKLQGSPSRAFGVGPRTSRMMCPKCGRKYVEKNLVAHMKLYCEPRKRKTKN